jgi:hypothetical protein
VQQFQFGEDLAKCDSIRKPTAAVNRSVAPASLKLEHLAASFIVDASPFLRNRTLLGVAKANFACPHFKNTYARRELHRDLSYDSGSGGNSHEDATIGNRGDLERKKGVDGALSPPSHPSRLNFEATFGLPQA